MRSGSYILLSALLLATALPASATTKPRKSTHLLTRRAAARPAAPRGIDPDRATQIQTALIKQGYLTGTPSGHWDNDTQAAMEKLQADNGWQTKLVPDARAIIKLGLGPNTPTPTETASTPKP